MRSIQARLASGLVFSLIVLLIIQWVIVGRSIANLSEHYIASRLVHTSDLLIAAININPAGMPKVDESRIDPIFTKPFSGYYYTIKSGKHLFRSRSLWDETLPQSGANGSSITYTTGPQGQHLLVVASEYTKQQHNFQVTIAEDITAISADMRSLSVKHAIVSAVILLILITVQYLVVRRSLTPLGRISKDLQKLEHGVIQSLDENVPREIYSLVREINLRVAAFQQRLQRSRRATGNLAHTLKRPLTLLNQLCDSTDAALNSEIRQTIRAYTEEIRQIIDRELKRARLAGSAVGSGQTNVRVELKTLIDLLQVMYREKSLDLELAITPDCNIGMDREDFHELLGNILDNACKWAKHHVLISYKCDESKILITIEDDGPGIPSQQLSSILQRGTRLDEQTAGHGLGLSIVKDVVEQYQGAIELSGSKKLGGLKVDIQL